jgi:RNA 2',3'-cyclic 3'-phosphodiesterase
VRVFAALPLPPEAVLSLGALLEPLRVSCPRLRFVREEGLHITLHFFGELGDAQAAELGSLWEEPGMAGPEIPATFGPVGQFPPRGTPRVIWVGIERGRADVEAYAARFQARVSALGFAPDPRGFTPHITLARNPGEAMDPSWAGRLSPDGAAFSFRECVLFQSVLSPRGSTYVALRRAVFGRSAP